MSNTSEEEFNELNRIADYMLENGVTLLEMTNIIVVNSNNISRISSGLYYYPDEEAFINESLESSYNTYDESKNIDRSGVLVYSETQFSSNESNNCSICLEDFKINDEYIKLNCNHIFHYDCINKWFKHSNLCPICRSKI